MSGTKNDYINLQNEYQEKLNQLEEEPTEMTVIRTGLLKTILQDYITILEDEKSSEGFLDQRHKKLLELAKEELSNLN